MRGPCRLSARARTLCCCVLLLAAAAAGTGPQNTYFSDPEEQKEHVQRGGTKQRQSQRTPRREHPRFRASPPKPPPTPKTSFNQHGSVVSLHLEHGSLKVAHRPTSKQVNLLPPWGGRIVVAKRRYHDLEHHTILRRSELERALAVNVSSELAINFHASVIERPGR